MRHRMNPKFTTNYMWNECPSLPSSPARFSNPIYYLPVSTRARLGFAVTSSGTGKVTDKTTANLKRQPIPACPPQPGRRTREGGRQTGWRRARTRGPTRDPPRANTCYRCRRCGWMDHHRRPSTAMTKATARTRQCWRLRPLLSRSRKSCRRGDGGRRPRPPAWRRPSTRGWSPSQPRPSCRTWRASIWGRGWVKFFDADS